MAQTSLRAIRSIPVRRRGAATSPRGFHVRRSASRSPGCAGITYCRHSVIIEPQELVERHRRDMLTPLLTISKIRDRLWRSAPAEQPKHAPDTGAGGNRSQKYAQQDHLPATCAPERIEAE